MENSNFVQAFKTFDMKLAPSPYAMIASGKKTIELRLYDEKRSQIEVGDFIVFTNLLDGESVKANVLALHRFKNFEELYNCLPLLKCGYTEENVSTANYCDMNIYYSYEKQLKYGVVGIEFCLLNE